MGFILVDTINKMAKLETVEYEKENGNLVAIEVYSDGSRRKVSIKNGICDYIINGSDDLID